MVDGKKKEDGRNRSSSSTIQSINMHTWVLGFLIAAGFIFCYASVLATLASQWSSNETYSHGFFIPLISGYILWISREKLAQYRPRPSYAAGAVILFVGASMLLGGQLGAVVVVQELSLIITIFGLVVLILGTRILKAVWLPIAYLSLMIPMWDWIIDRLYPWFQNFSADIGATLLAALGIPVYHQGVYIQLPNITVEVARQFEALGFSILATEGTYKAFQENGIKASHILKVHEGRPNITDKIIDGEINLVVNTPIGKKSQWDDSYIRKSAIKYKIPYITTLAAANAAAEGITALRQDGSEVHSLQEHHSRLQ